MKQLIIVCTLLFAMYGCKKNNMVSRPLVNSNPFLDSAIQYLKLNLSQNQLDQLDLTKCKVIGYKNQNWGIQIFEKDSNKFLLMQRKNSVYIGNWVDLSGLVKNPAHRNSGNIMLTGLDNSSVTKLVVVNNEVTGMEKTGKNILSLATEPTVLPEVIVYYDVNGSGIDYYSWYWLLDQASSSTYDYFTTGSGGGSTSGGSGYSSVAAAPIVTGPDAPILDLSKEVKCFTSNSTSTYNISVNVNEPDPGTRDVVNPLSSFPVGHTFLTLEQHNADGTSVIRTLGFYPRNSVKPGSETDQSIFGDDSYTPYDVSLDFTVTGSEMNKVIVKLLDQQSLQYDLDNFNCTNSPMEALKSININLPSTKSTGTLFYGNDPGDLGEDIRSLNLNTFSAQNGNRKITRTVSNLNNQYSKGKAGGC